MEESTRTAAPTVVTRAGFVALVGRPNAGKSALLNRLVGEHIAAVSHKEQTTRHRIPGFLTTPDTQIVFVDTPGLLDPGYALQEAMLQTALDALEGVDAAYFLVDHEAPSGREREVLGRLATSGVALFLLLTKADRVSDAELDRRQVAWREIAAWAGIHRVSALTGAGLDPLLAETTERLPQQPFFYPSDDLTNLPLRFIAAELVREACYEELVEEVPYSVHVAVEEWKEPSSSGNKTVVRAAIYVERDSQKAIVIGEGGRKLKAIGTRARHAIEELISGPVYLELRVKVKKKWSRRESDVRWFGYRT
jgi:GTP-binding protein Era